MKKILFLALTMMCVNFSFAADAKDFVAVCPKTAKVLFENETIRMLLLKQSKGEVCGIGFHRTHVDYHIKGVDLKIGMPDGSSTIIKIPEGTSFPAGEGVYSFEVVSGQLELVIVEFK